MAINFPDSPVNGETYKPPGSPFTYQYDSTLNAWNILAVDPGQIHYDLVDFVNIDLIAPVASIELDLYSDPDWIDIVGYNYLSHNNASNALISFRLRNEAGTIRSGAADYTTSSQATSVGGYNSGAAPQGVLYGHVGYAGSPNNFRWNGNLQFFGAGIPTNLTVNIHHTGILGVGSLGAAYSFGSSNVSIAAERHTSIIIFPSAGSLTTGNVWTARMRYKR